MVNQRRLVYDPRLPTRYEMREVVNLFEPFARFGERVPIRACIYLAVGDSDVWPSTTILSKSMSIFPSTIGSRGNISEGGYHGCFSTTPFWTAFATNFPISSPSKGTSFLSLSYL